MEGRHNPRPLVKGRTLPIHKTLGSRSEDKIFTVKTRGPGPQTEQGRQVKNPGNLSRKLRRQSNGERRKEQRGGWGNGGTGHSLWKRDTKTDGLDPNTSVDIPGDINLERTEVLHGVRFDLGEPIKSGYHGQKSPVNPHRLCLRYSHTTSEGPYTLHK